MNIKTLLMMCGLAVCQLAQPALAGALEDGMAAFAHGYYTKALKLVQPLAEQGDAKAQNLIGLIYADGKGVPQDFAEAVKWYRKAADQGYAGAQNNLGLMYLKGRGVPQDYVQAYVWFDLTAAGLSVSKTGMHGNA
ncbi:MAG: tetratricopeptide repeat protein, partial [Aestuariivirga sp.]